MINIMDTFQLKNKKALVTGGGSGIGRAYCHALAQAGADVAVVDVNITAAEKVALELKTYGCSSFALKADISVEDEVADMINQIKINWNRLDIAVNNAGITHRDNAENIRMEIWDRVINTNLRGSFICAQKESEIMIPQGYGKIIFTVSMSSQIINIPQMHVAYGTSKAGIEHLVKCLGYEWIKYGINVNGISPGGVLTPQVVDRLPELIPVWEDMYPIKRMAQPEEFMGALVYLASDASSFMVGQCMVIDGGYTLI